MSNSYKQSVLKRAKQNRTNRATNSAKEYGKKLSKSQQQYIAGDYISSASNKAYGYEKYGMPDKELRTGGLSYSGWKTKQEGGDPYKATYIYDGKKRTATNNEGEKYTTRKRFLTDDEKKAYKATGSTNVSNYKKNYDYAIFRGVDSDGKNFDSNLNLRNKDGSMKWDGMNVARNKVRNGSSKLNYVGGFLKDTVVDGGMDFLKKFDRYESAGMGGLLGVAENTQDVVDSITSGDFSFKNLDTGRIKKNWNESMEESNKTGWGHSAGHYLKGMSERNDNQRYEDILRTQGKESADAFRKTEQKVQGVENVANTVMGIGLDFANPIQLGSAFAKTFKYAGKNTLKAGKDLFKGTGDLSVAFKSDPLRMQEMINKYANRSSKVSKLKKGDSAIETLTDTGSIKHNKRGSMLDQEYERVMSKTEQVKEVVKSNPKTQNLGSFLDEIGETSKPIAKNSDEALYFKTISRFTDDIDEIIKDVNDLPVDQADRFYDWIEKNNPELFEKLSGDITPVIDSHVEELRLSKFIDDIIGEKPPKIEEDLGLSFDSTIQNNKELAKKYDELNKSRLLADDIVLPKRADYTELKNNFTNFGDNIKKQLGSGDYTFVNKLQNTMKDIDIDKLSKDDDYKMKIIEKLNKELFGDNMIKSNIDKGNLTSFVNHLDDVLNYNLTKQSGGYSFKPKGTYRGTKKGVHHMYDRNNNPNEINLNTSFHAPSLLDENFRDKMSFVDKLVGIKSRSELDTPIKTFEETMKKHGFTLLTGKEKALYNQMMKEHGYVTKGLEQKMIKNGYSKLSPKEQKEYNSLVNRLEIRDKAYAEVSNMNGEEFIAHKGKYGQGDVHDDVRIESFYATNNRKLTIDDFYNEVAEEIEGTQKLKDYIEEGGNVDELIEQQAKIKYYDYLNENEGYKLKQNIDNRNATITEASELDRKLSESPRLEQENLSNVGEIVDDIAHRSEIIYKDLKLNKPKINKSKIKLSNGQKLGHLPPVKENSAGLKRVIQHEIEMMYREPKKYLDYKDSFKQIKKDYIKSMRSYGVKDSSYFEKVKNLQNDLDLYYKSLNKPESIIKKVSESEELSNPAKAKSKDGMSMSEIHERKLNKAKEGGPGTPKNGMNMNLQLLAKKIEDAFNEFDENVAKEFGEEWQTLTDRNINSIESLQKRTNKATKNVDTSNHTPYDYDEMASGEDVLEDFWSKMNGDKTKGKLNNFLKSIEEKFANSDLSGNNLEKILDSKKKKYLKQKGVSDANNPLYKNFKVKDGQLPSKSAKRLENGNVVDLESGQVKYANQNKGDLKKIVQDNKYHYKNKEEDELIKKLLSNPDPKPEHFMGLFDKMKIKCDFSDEKSVEKAFKQFNNIVEKKIRKGDIVLNESKEVPKTYNAKNLEEFEKSPLSVLSEKLAEAKKYGDDVSAKYFEKQINSRGTDEIIKNIKQARTIEDKQKLYERLMQQSEYAYDESKGFNYYEEMSDWLMNQGGLDIREKNAIMDYMKKEQAKLASKGIDPNVIENKQMRESMRKQQYDHETNRNYETAQAKKSDLEKILEKEKNRKPNQTIVDKIKSSDGVVREPKPKKRIRVKEAEEQVTKNLKLDEEMDKKIAEYLGRNSNDVTKKIESTKSTPLDNIAPRTADDMLENELSDKNIGKTLDKDITAFEKELSQENPPTFEKFKKFFTDKSENTTIGYEDSPTYKVYKAWLNSWKKGLTIYNPGWHLQNFFQNKGQNYLALGMDAFGSQKNAKNVLSKINGVDKGAYELTSKTGQKYTKEELAQLAKKHNVAEGMATNTTRSNGVFPWLESKVDNSKTMQRALQSEQTARLHHFLTQLERGVSPEDASKSVNKYLFDYAHKSKADKVMSDFVDPFWSFHKNNAKLLTTAPFKHPSEVNKILRVNRELDDTVEDDKKVPNEFREHQSPFGSFKDELNDDTYNYFYDENMLPDVTNSLPINGDDFENKLNPLLRMALQQSRGEGNFGNKLVDKDEAAWGETTKDERKGEIARELNPVMNPLVKAYYKSKEHQKKTDEGKQTQTTTDKQKLMELLAYAFGNKGNYYRDNR